MRVLIAAGPHYRNARRVFDQLDALHQHREPIQEVFTPVICPAGEAARIWAELHGVSPVDRRDLAHLLVDLVLQFPGGQQTDRRFRDIETLVVE